MNTKTIVFPGIINHELQEQLKIKSELRANVKHYNQFVCKNEDHDHVMATMKSCVNQ